MTDAATVPGSATTWRGEERRLSNRSKIIPRIRVKITKYDGSELDGDIIDISQTGACISGVCAGAIGDRIELARRDEPPIVNENDPFSFVKEGEGKPCEITRVVNEEGNKCTGMKFTIPLTEEELDALPFYPGAESTFNAGQADREQVQREITSLKTSRDHFFVWALGVLSASFVGISSLVHSSSAIPPILPAAVQLLCFHLIFTIVLEKLRTISLREGFVAAMDHYVRNGEGPLNYRGWMQLKHCTLNCMPRRRSNMCPRKKEDIKNEWTCRREAEAKSAYLTSAREFIPVTINTFTSIVFFAFMASAIGVFIGVGYCLSAQVIPLKIVSDPNSAFYEWTALNFFSVTWMWYWIGMLVYFLYFFMIYQIVENFLPKQVFIRKMTSKIYMVLDIIGLMTAFIANLYLLNVDKVAPWFFLAGVCGFGFVYGFCFMKIFRRLYDIRLGENSFEVNSQMWAIILNTCFILPEDTRRLGYFTNWGLPSRILRIGLHLFVCRKTHADLVDEYNLSVNGSATARNE